MGTAGRRGASATIGATSATACACARPPSTDRPRSPGIRVHESCARPFGIVRHVVVDRYGSIRSHRSVDRHPRGRTRSIDRGPVRGQDTCRLRRRRDQDRAAGLRRSVAQVAPAEGRHVGVVADPVAQQALARARPEAAGRPGDRTCAGPRGRCADRELPPRCDGRLRARPRRPDAHEPASDRAAGQRIRSDRPLSRQTRFRRGGGSHGRAAPSQRRARPDPRAGRHQHRRHAGSAAWRDRHPRSRSDIAAAAGR